MSIQTLPLLNRLEYCADAFAYRRRETRVVSVGGVGVGGDHPIRVQSMTTTRTQDVEATVAQAERLARAGCEIVRITAPTVQDARAIGEIRKGLASRGVAAPLVADIHFSPAAAMMAADYVDKVRVNPGNYADSRQFAVREYTDAEYERELERIEERFTPLVLKCKARGIAMRVGTNHGSLSDRIMNRFGDTPLGMVESALEFLRICERNDYGDVILSMKASNPKVMIQAYRLLVARMNQLGMDYPLHLGVTEAGNAEDGRIKSAVGIGALLDDGLGDTIRVSLTEAPEAEIPVAIRLAAPYQGRQPRVYAGTSVPERRDPYSFARRPSSELTAGPVSFGGRETIRVVRREPPESPDPVATLIDMVTADRPGVVAPDVVTLNIERGHDMHELGSLEGDVTTRVPEFAIAARGYPEASAAGRWGELASLAHLLHWASSAEPPPSDLLTAARAYRRMILLETSTAGDDVAVAVERLVGWAEQLREAGLPEPMLAIEAPDASTSIRAYRLLAARLAQVGLSCPLHLVAPSEDNPYERLLRSSVALGSLLCDGIGDSVEIRGGEGRGAVRLAFDILQASGARISKTEFVACPSCGRTLFDLEPTTDRIKAQTGHLKGVKIAIMGCIVNGPGEMADADFGYVGGAPGMVNLYVGKECVERNVPQERADERLIALLREHGRWTEPPS
ncbi:MAG: (E)-4-hydroxy-3-methylbut-2-enyl-diphosphate synthase [Chloroflexi bacterium]|nr:(E)-4-hydroxy-3-methylbut-2-enyl-diphosphate synthase [Chloroflexota bacterium]